MNEILVNVCRTEHLQGVVQTPFDLGRLRKMWPYFRSDEDVLARKSRVIGQPLLKCRANFIFEACLPHRPYDDEKSSKKVQMTCRGEGEERSRWDNKLRLLYIPKCGTLVQFPSYRQRKLGELQIQKSQIMLRTQVM